VQARPWHADRQTLPEDGHFVAPPASLGIAGASVVIQFVKKILEAPADHAERKLVFNMLTGLRRNIIRRSGVKEII
jgi:hypothetical protein